MAIGGYTHITKTNRAALNALTDKASFSVKLHYVFLLRLYLDQYDNDMLFERLFMLKYQISIVTTGHSTLPILRIVYLHSIRVHYDY